MSWFINVVTFQEANMCRDLVCLSGLCFLCLCLLFRGNIFVLEATVVKLRHQNVAALTLAQPRGSNDFDSQFRCTQ